MEVRPAISTFSFFSVSLAGCDPEIPWRRMNKCLINNFRFLMNDLLSFFWAGFGYHKGILHALRLHWRLYLSIRQLRRRKFGTGPIVLGKGRTIRGKGVLKSSDLKPAFHQVHLTIAYTSESRDKDKVVIPLERFWQIVRERQSTL